MCVRVKRYYIIITAIWLLSSHTASKGQTIEDYVDFSRITMFDSIVIRDNSMKKEISFSYRNKRLDNIFYFDSLSMGAAKFYTYDSSGRLQRIESKACKWITSASQKRYCASFFTYQKKFYTYDSIDKIKNEVIIGNLGGLSTDSLVREFSYSKNSVHIRCTGWWSGESEIKFDKNQRLVSLIESNLNGEYYSKTDVIYKNKVMLVTRKIYRSYIDDTPCEEITNNWSINYDEKKLPKSFFNGKWHSINYY
jgi:hypothetical protein